MLTGMDIGGTNTDVACISDDIFCIKVPNELGFAAALEHVPRKGRLAVSTSQPLNRVISGTPLKVQSIIIPGPGLFYPSGISGAINHRGDLVEALDPEEVRKVLEDNHADVLSISAKFSVRNPEIEDTLADIAREYYPEEHIAVSHVLGQLNFPARIATTDLNACMKATVLGISRMIREHIPDFYYFKGDGGLVPPDMAHRNPGLLYHSSSAAVALGAYYLSREKDCLVVDIGGTTTDLVPLRDGKPVMERVNVDGRKTLIRSVTAQSLPYGGDSYIGVRLEHGRIGNALAFGGTGPALTDALNCCGHSIGDRERSLVMDPDIAREAVRYYISLLSETVMSYKPQKIVGTGYLSRWLIPLLSRKTGVPASLPEYCESANAVGVAVSRVSMTLWGHFDTGRRRAVINGELVPLPAWNDDDDLIAACRETLREMALGAGADPKDLKEISLVYFNSYDVVRGGYRSERIADIVMQVEPGITAGVL